MENAPTPQKERIYVKEYMTLPEISVAQEDGELLMSLLLKAYNPTWGERDHPIAKSVAQHFTDHPIPHDLHEKITVLNIDAETGVDEETLYHCALIYNHPERIDSMISFISTHKNHIAINASEICQQIVDLLHDIKKIIPAHLWQSITGFTAQDTALRKETMEITKKDFQNTLDFFMPRKNLSPITHITLLPTDPLYSKESGSGFDLGDQGFLRYDINNKDSRVHEFLHFIINPMIEKLSESLSDTQKESILKMSSKRLRVDQGYGDHYQSLLCEELIRAYTTYIMKNEKPLTYDGFSHTIDSLTAEQFSEIFQKEKQRPINRFMTLDIQTFDDIRAKKKDFFEHYVSSTLATNIATLYENFSQQKSIHPQTSFEDFLHRNSNILFTEKIIAEF